MLMESFYIQEALLKRYLPKLFNHLVSSVNTGQKLNMILKLNICRLIWDYQVIFMLQDGTLHYLPEVS